MDGLSLGTLKTKDGNELKAETLFSEKPVVVVVLRRPGCVLCRAEAQELWALKDEFEKMGVGMACVVHEWIQREIDAFHPAFWGGDLYHDVDKAFYKALNNGQVLRGNLWPLLNPFGAFWKRVNQARQKVAEHNVVGDGLTMGGLLVLGKGGKPYMVHVEKELGLTAAHDKIREAAQRAAADAAKQ